MNVPNRCRVRRRLRTAVLGAVLAVTSVQVLPASQAAAAPKHADSSTSCQSGFGSKTPVLLVHGFNDDASSWKTDVANINARADYTASAFQYGGTTADDANLNTYWVLDPGISQLLAETIVCLAANSRAGGGAGKVALIGHSMGGLAIRCAIDSKCTPHVNDAGNNVASDVGVVVTIGTPSTGSFLLGGPARSLVEQTYLTVAAGECAAIGLYTFEVLTPICRQLKAFISPAARAFREGSTQLATLPPPPPKLPWLALAGSVEVTTNIGFVYTQSLGNLGDLVVGRASAQAVNQVVNGVGGTQIIHCGSLSFGGWATVLTALSAGLGAAGAVADLFSKLKCWHGTETSSALFLEPAMNAVSKWRGQSLANTPPPVIGPTTYGPFVMGETIAQAKQAAPTLVVTPAGSCPTGTFFGATLFFSPAGQLVFINTMQRPIPAANGIKIGETVAQLLKDHPGMTFNSNDPQAVLPVAPGSLLRYWLHVRGSTGTATMDDGTPDPAAIVTSIDLNDRQGCFG